MLFNSYEFIFLFLPIALAGYFLLARKRPTVSALWISLASIFFYGWWNPKYVILLLGSITVNFMASRAINKALETQVPLRAKQLLVAAICFNLGLLVYFKYAGFFASTLNITGVGTRTIEIVLPLGISFFTFTQIAFLVDCYRGIAKEYSPIHYLLFVTYFPHLIAGPILHHKEMMPQFADARNYRWSWENISVGLTIFFIGLAKKVLIADQIAVYVGPVFDLQQDLNFFQAWGGAVAYTLQLYFDFSGYSDMAIGLSRLFGIKLPLNFDSPYKARNAIDFWRRWHMTLSRFLRDYLYIPLGGNRLGNSRRNLNIMVTMVLGGLWHGAGWTFVLWGMLHGFYLVINHAWLTLVAKPLGLGNGRIYRFVAWLLTFLAVVVAWVFFRAKDMDAALHMIEAMSGMTTWVDEPFKFSKFREQFNWTVALLGLVFVAPNTQQIMCRFEPTPGYECAAPSRLVWAPTLAWTLFTAAVAIWSVMAIPHGQGLSEFLYYQF